MVDSVPSGHVPTRVPRLATGLAGVALAVLAVAMVALAHGALAPSPAEVLRGDAGMTQRHLWALAAATAAAVAAALAAPVGARRRGVDAFAHLVAAPAAAGLVLVAARCDAVAAWWDAPWQVVGMSLLAVGVVWSLAPLARDRGVAALALAAAAAALPTLLAVRSALLRSATTPVLAALGSAAAPERLAGPVVVLLLDAGTDGDLAAALVRVLRPPFRAAPLDALLAEADSAAAQWLQRMEWPALRVRGAEVQWCPWTPLHARLRAGGLAVRAQRTEGVVAVACEQAPLGSTALLFSAAGSLALAWDPSHPGRWTVGADAPAEARSWAARLAALPSGMRSRVLVAPPDPADAYGWIDWIP